MKRKNFAGSVKLAKEQRHTEKKLDAESKKRNRTFHNEFNVQKKSLARIRA